MRVSVLLAGCVAAILSTSATSLQQQPGSTAIRVRSAILPVVNETGNRAFDSLTIRLEELAAAKAREVPAAELTRVSTLTGINARDPLSTIATRTRATIIVRASITSTANTLQFTATAVNAADGAVFHRLVESAPANNPTPAIQRLASRIAGMLAMHADPERTMPQLYSVSTLEAYRIQKRGDSVFNTNQAAALPLLYQAYQLDTMNLNPLFLATAIHRNAGRAAVGDSLLTVIEARRDRLTEVETFNIGWYRGNPLEQYAAAQGGARLDPNGWGFAVGIRANAVGYYVEAVEALSRRAVLVAQGNYGAKTWGGWRAQIITALHASGDYARELAEIKLARSDFARENIYVPEEMRALAALGRVQELRPITTRYLAVRADSVNLDLLVNVAMELKRHGQKQAGDALIAELATFALANEPRLDSLAVASILGAARRFDEAFVRFEKMTSVTPSVQARRGRYAMVAATAGRKDIVDRMLTSITGEGAPAYLIRGNVAAASGDCQTAVTHFKTAVQKGQGFGVPGWWHIAVSTEPIWGCEAFEKLPPMKAPG